MRPTALILTLAALCAPPTRCQEASGSPVIASAEKGAEGADTLRLAQVEVRARRPYADLIPAQVLGAKEIERLSAHSVADAMRYFSGIQIKDYGGIGGVKTVDMRSMGTNHMGIFYDGIQLGNAQNGQIDLGKYSLDNIESINLYNGQRSEIFQSAKDFGSAGTVYIQTRRPHFEEGERPWKVSAAMRCGSFGLANPSVRIENKLGSKVTSTLSGEYTYATGRYRFRYRRVLPSGATAWDTTATRRNGDLEAGRLEGGLFGQLPRGGYWQAKAYYYRSERGIPGAIVNNVWKNAQRQWDSDFFVQGRLRHNFSRLYALQVNAKYARDYTRYFNPDTTLMYVDNRFWQQEVYVSAANRFTIIPRALTANISADYQWNALRSTLRQSGTPRRHTLLVAGAVAASWRHFRAQGSLLATMVRDRFRASQSGKVQRKSLDRLTPAIFTSYMPLGSEELTLRAFYKRIFRMPTFNDLYYTDIGNARLRPEYATQYNIGATWHRDFRATLFSSLELKADAYYNRITDKIIAVPKGTGQYRWMMMNIGRVHIRGIDVGATAAAEPVGGLLAQLRLNYTYQRAQDYTDPADCHDAAGTYRAQIAYIPRHSGSVVAAASWRRLELNYSFIYVGERYHNSSNIPANYEPAWYTHDITASYSLRWGQATLRLTAEVNNLLNQQYEVIQNYPMPGRNFKFILRCDI